MAFEGYSGLPVRSSGADRFAPRYLVGNVPAGDPAVAQLGPFRYIPDPGDGSGIATALTEAAANAGTVFVRRGTYTLLATLVVPSNVKLCGEGAATLIQGPLALGVQLSGVTSEVVDIRFNNLTTAIQMMAAATESVVRSCRFTGTTNAVDLTTSTSPMVVDNYLHGGLVLSGLATTPEVSRNIS